MSALQGYRLQASAPNAQGLCTFTIVEKSGLEVAHIDRPCTLDEALAAARVFVEQEMQNGVENENNFMGSAQVP